MLLNANFALVFDQRHLITGIWQGYLFGAFALRIWSGSNQGLQSGLQSSMSDDASEIATGGGLAGVPLFPLPNVVLFPRAILPLHIFEERYKAMISAALAGERQIAMALLRPGWEKNYHGAAAIEPVVCVGTILAHERLGDGKYNLLLQGSARAKIVREPTVRPYRTAELQVMTEPRVLEIDLSNHRRQLISLFSNGRLSSLPICEKFLEMLGGTSSTSNVVDLVAFNLIEDIATKQQLLSEPDPCRRAERVVSALENLQILIRPGDGSAGDVSMN